MYRECCCYCESKVGVVEFGNIEHRMPKKRFPESTYDWDNLHLSCTRCNVIKKRKWSTRYPILDSVTDPISDHLDYTYDPQGLWREPRTMRGKTTVGHADLNRDGLLKARTEVFLEVMNLIKEICEAPNAPAASVTRSRIMAMRSGRFGSMISHAIDHYLGRP
jgi:uncharacterized protein (TIGR02646 family)